MLRSLLRWMIINAPAMNILLAAVLIVGCYCAAQLRRETFPEFDLEYITVTGVRMKKQNADFKTVLSISSPTCYNAVLCQYPTQKLEALMERIIKCASSEGDLILDPFMGGGTTLAAADKLHRQWIGIDQSVMAVKVTEARMKKQSSYFETVISV